MNLLKKLLAIIMALTIVLGCTACGREKKPETPEDFKPQGEALLTVGVVSDSQIDGFSKNPSETQYNGPEQLKRALQYYKDNDCDVIFYMGDVVNNAKDESWQLYTSVFESVFPNKKPEDKPRIVFNLGNHERYIGYKDPVTGSLNNEAYTTAQFIKYTGLNPRQHIEVDGYHFITIDSRVYDSPDSFSPQAIKYLEDEIVKAAEASTDGRPIFVGIHEPITGTVYGEGFSKQSAKINGILKDYPNVILFSGHSHYPIADDRSIYQKNFTVVNTGSCSYCCIGEYKDGKYCNAAGIPFDNVHTNSVPKTNEASGTVANEQGLGLIVKVYKNGTQIERRNFNKNTSYGDMWNIPFNPNKETDFFYTKAREKVEDVITWKEDHNVKTTYNSYNVAVEWDEAIKDKFEVESYKIELMKFGTDTVLDSKCIVSDYWACLGPKNYKVMLNTDTPADKYEVVITPYNCFGKAGEKMTVEVSRKK